MPPTTNANPSTLVQSANAPIPDILTLRIVCGPSDRCPPLATVATVTASIQVQRRPAKTIDDERPNVTIPLGRFALCCRDVR